MLNRLKAYFRLDRDMDDEMSIHIEQYREDLIRQGVPPAEAQWQARRAFGNRSRISEDGREAKGFLMVDELVRNLTYAWRQLRRSPGFAASVILTLALCIGVNTAVFSVIDAVLLRRLPYPEPDRLLDVVRQFNNSSGQVSSNGQDGNAWNALKDSRSIQVAAMSGTSGVNLTTGNRAFYVRQQRVSIRYFSVLGIPLERGREFEPAEDRDGGPDVAVLSYSIWKRFFNGDPSIVGQTIRLRGSPYTVAGVTGEKFSARAVVDVWTPLKPSTKGEGGGTNYEILGRLNPGVSLAEAQREIQSRGAAAFEASKDPETKGARMNLAPFEKTDQAGLRERLLILSAAVGVVLLIGCVNIASLMLARGATRRREMGTRIALGGGPGPLMRQLTTESIVLGSLGGAVGLILGYIVIETLQTVIADYGIWQELRLDGRVLAATLILTFLVSLLFGLAPAFQAAHVDVRATLLEGGSRSVAGGGGQWMRRALVVAEVALSLVLLVGAGLLVRTLLHLQHRDPGFDGSNVLTASASLQDARYADSASVNRMYRASLLAMQGIPGVESAAVGLHLPYQRWLNGGVVVRAGAGLGDKDVGTSMNYVTPGYFETLRIPLRAGRLFDERDSENAAPVVLVNETFARKFLNGQDPLAGRLLGRNGTRQIVGIVSDLQQRPGLSRSGPIVLEPAVYYPAAQFSAGSLTMIHTWFSPNWIVRAAGPRAEIARGIEQAIASVDPMLPVARFMSLVEERDSALKSQRINAWLLGLLAGLAAALALVGIYGIVANSVGERTREFGIRMALGSSLNDVIRHAIAPGIWLSLAGVAVGAVLALASVTLIKGLLWGVQPMDPATFLMMGVAVIGVSAFASLLPALKLTRLDPASVLRQE